MDEDKEVYTDDLKDLKKIAEPFKIEINRTYKLVEEFYSIQHDKKELRFKICKNFMRWRLYI